MLYSPDDQAYVRVQSLDFPDEDYFHIDHVPEMLPGFWGNYLRGAVLSLSRSYRLTRGLRGVVRGRLPMGGLSSSAAVITAYLLALCDVNGITCAPEELIQLSHWVEVSFIGLNNGILDQAANILSRKGQLMVMDCRTADWELVAPPPAMPPYTVLIVNSGFTQALISTDYNNRVDECKIAASVLEEYAHGRMSPYREARLANLTMDDWQHYSQQLPGRLGRRARHYFTENQRVRDGVAAWRRGDLATFGSLMFASGDSSIHDYECGCPELITIFEALKTAPGVHGARFSGAGYRGCCIGLADPAAAEAIERHIAAIYPVRHPRYADSYSIHFCQPADGAALVHSCHDSAVLS
jgi:galactokinase